VAKIASHSFPPVEEIAEGRYTHESCPCPSNCIPVPDHIFMHYLSTSTSKHQNWTWGPRIPQKLGHSLLASTEPSPEGWGIQIKETLNWSLLAFLSMAFVLVGITIGVVYSVCAKDSQTGLAIAAYLAAVQTLTLAFVTLAFN
jgi:hypothetical protein